MELQYEHGGEREREKRKLRIKWKSGERKGKDRKKETKEIKRK